jgi:YVTN family beta-propeller protein
MQRPHILVCALSVVVLPLAGCGSALRERTLAGRVEPRGLAMTLPLRARGVAPLCRAIVGLLAFASIAGAEPFAYVVGVPNAPGNRAQQMLTVIDVPTRAKVAVIPLGQGCLCVYESAAASPDGTRIYVSNFWDNSVSVVDLATRSVIKTFTGVPLASSLVVSPDNTRLYVNASIYPSPGYFVQVLDTDSGATVATIPLSVPQSGSGLAIAPDGKRLYVTNQALNGSNVKVVDLTSNTVIATVPLPTVPRGIDLTPDGRFAYVSVQEANAAAAISTATNTVVATVAAGTRPNGMRVLPNGSRAYAVSQDFITVIATATNTSLGTIPAFLPRAIDFTPDSATAVVAADARVYIVDTATSSIAATIPFATATEGNPIFVAIPQAVPLPPEAPSGLYVTSVVDNTVALRWTPPAAGPAPSGYLLEGGVNPGQVLGSISTGSETPTFTFTAPTGSFYVRLHATGPGGRSAASNEIQIHVSTGAAPSAPADLLGLADGSSLALAWRNTFDGGSPASLILDVSGTTSLTLPLGLTDTFSFAGVPAGTYTLAVRALNASGIVGPPSNAISLTFPAGCTGSPETPTKLLAYRIGNTIHVIWDAPTGGPAPTGYLLNVTGAFSGSFPTGARELRGAVGAGVYGLSVSATNGCGASAATPVQVVVVP